MANIFAIDIGDRYTRLVELKENNKKIEILTMGYNKTAPNFYNSESLKNIEQQAAIINEIYSSLKIKERSVRIIIPDTYSFYKIITVPLLNEKELQSAIRYQADQFIPLPIDDVSLDIEVLNEDKKKRQASILIVASPKKLIAQIERTIDYGGLFPEVVENEYNAARRMILNKRLAGLSDQTTYIIINFGFNTSTLYLVNIEQKIFLNHNLKIGLQILIKDIKANLNIDDEKAYEILQTIGFSSSGSTEIKPYITPIIDELVKEVNRLTVLAKERYNLTPQQIYLFNYDSFICELDKHIEKTVPLPTAAIPLDQIIVKNNLVANYQKELTSFFSVVATSLP